METFKSTTDAVDAVCSCENQCIILNRYLQKFGETCIYWMLSDYCNISPGLWFLWRPTYWWCTVRVKRRPRKALKLLQYCYISHTRQALFTYRFSYGIAKYYRQWQPRYASIIMHWIISSLSIPLKNSIKSLNSTIAIQQNHYK